MVKKETTEQTKQGGKEEEEPSFERILHEEFRAMDKQLDNLTTQSNELNTAVQKVTSVIYAPIRIDEETKKIVPPGEFADPASFRNNLDGLYTYLGQALDYVVRLEKQRGTVFQQEQQETELPSERREERNMPSPVTLHLNQTPVPAVPNAEQQPQKFGFFAWRTKVAEMKLAEKKAEQEENIQQPVVATSKIIDVVEFGRQLQPAFNKVKRWFIGTLAEIRQYPDEHIYFVRHGELATFFGQTIGALITFVNARLEYRRSLIEGRKLALVRSMARIAEARSMAPQVQVGGTFAQKGYKLSSEGFGERT